MKIQLLIPHYKDDQKLVERLLNSVQLQQNIDFKDVGVIIVNDGDEKLLEAEAFKKYSFKIDYYVIPWGDVSNARKEALTYATADYVMFADADDLFYRNNALFDIFRKIDAEHPDILTSTFVEDAFYDNGAFSQYVNHENDNVWIHGKVYNRDFLVKNDINWEPSLMHYYEDAFFVRLCNALTNKTSHISEPTWFWKYRPGSLVRTDYGWVNKTYDKRINSSIALIDNLIQRNCNKAAANYVFVQVYEGYFTLLEDFWEQSEEFKEKKIEVRSKLKDFYLKYNYLLEQVPEESACIMIDVLRKRYYTEKKRVSLDKITFNDWLKDLLK